MNLLITGAWQQASAFIKQLELTGNCVTFLQQETDALPCPYDWVDGVICNGLFLSHPIEQFQNLRYIQLTSAGLDRVPMDYIREHEIPIFNAQGVYSIPMAEFAVCGVLQLYKQANFFRKNQAQHVWEKHRKLLELSGKTVCIVGCGSVGTACAQRFGAFGCHVVGIDLFPREDAHFSRMSGLDALAQELPHTDVLVLTLPLTPETCHMMDSQKFGQLKNGAVLVNIARGGVLDFDALEHALQTTLGGAVLDVFEEEPLPQSSTLWDMENVILTPHNSFVGDGNDHRLNQLILHNLQTHGDAKK